MRLIITGILTLILLVMVRPLQNKENLPAATYGFTFLETYYREFVSFYPENITPPLKREVHFFHRSSFLQTGKPGITTDSQTFVNV